MKWIIYYLKSTISLPFSLSLSLSLSNLKFADAVDLLSGMLSSQGMKCVSISGNTTKSARQEAVTTFSRDPKCIVFLLTMGAGAVGLTLTAANVVYLLEPSHSLADEAQAFNRAHRIGQR